MNDFFRSKTFKIIAVLLAAVLAFFLRAVYTGGLMPALSHIGGGGGPPLWRVFRGDRQRHPGFLPADFPRAGAAKGKRGPAEAGG
mgnify:CR=1 FL=1